MGAVIAVAALIAVVAVTGGSDDDSRLDELANDSEMLAWSGVSSPAADDRAGSQRAVTDRKRLIDDGCFVAVVP